MKYRLRDLMGKVDYDDLVRMKKDLENGGMHLQDLVDMKIKEESMKHRENCSICNNELDPRSTNNFTLVFGPHDFRKKASFCALDCLEYFLRNLKDIKCTKP